MFRTCSIALITACLATTSLAATVKNLSTGIDNASSTKIPEGSPDLNYVLAPGGTAGHAGQTLFAYATNIPSSYLPDSASANSRWIALNTGVGIQGTTTDPGTYIFQTSVNLDGFDPASTLIPSLQYAADNELINVAINGTSVFSQVDQFAEEFGTFTVLPANLGIGLFHAGNNTVSFTVSNQAGLQSPMALRVEGSVTANPVPEPITLSIAAPTALLFFKRQKK